MQRPNESIDTWYNGPNLQNMLVGMRALSLEQWVNIGALSNSSLACIATATQLTQTYFSRLPDERVINLVMRQRDSAVTIYKRASELSQNGSYVAAYSLMQDAFIEFHKTSLQEYNIDEMQSDRLLLAEMHLLESVCLLHMARTIQDMDKVVRSLNECLNFNRKSLVAYNLLAFINYVYLENQEQAKKHLLDSLFYSPEQVFANYYLAKINNNEEKMQQYVNELVKVFQSKINVAVQGPLDERYVRRNLSDTTLPFMVIYLFADWLKYSVANAKNAETLASIADICASCSITQAEEVYQKSAVIIFESRIIALDRLAKMKSHAKEFEPFDLAWRDLCGLPLLQANENDKPYVFAEFPASHIDKSILRLLEIKKHPLEFLLDEIYQHRMANLIKQWIAHGWLHADNNAEVQAIGANFKKIKHATGKDFEAVTAEIDKLCLSASLIKHFVATYVTYDNWDNLCRTVPMGNGISSLLHIICDHIHLELRVYCRNDDETRYQFNEACSFIGELVDAGIDAKTGVKKCIHVAYHPENNSLAFMSLLDTPSRVYSLLRSATCWDLLKKDKSNELAFRHLEKKGVTQSALPVKVVQQPHAPKPVRRIGFFNDLLTQEQSDFNAINLVKVERARIAANAKRKAREEWNNTYSGMVYNFVSRNALPLALGAFTLYAYFGSGINSSSSSSAAPAPAPAPK